LLKVTTGIARETKSRNEKKKVLAADLRHNA